MLHAIKFIMLCLATLVTMQHTHEIEGEEHIFPHLEYCRKRLTDLHVGALVKTLGKKGEGKWKREMFIRYQLMNN